ncbi:MAG: riboflavin synthase, partial [Pseudonocardiaceae bacterium]
PARLARGRGAHRGRRADRRSAQGVVAVFTGLVATVGTVSALERDRDGVRLRIASALAAELAPGDSVAVNGVCLTAVEPRADSFGADVMAETLRRSSLAPLGEGDEVNLELPLRAGDRFGGHMVQGHVDATGSVADVRDEGFARVVRIAAEPQLLRYVVEKGSIAVDGVSLTVSAVDEEAFEVSLIPETVERTTLGRAAPGRTVNLEVDVLAKYVEKLRA